MATYFQARGDRGNLQIDDDFLTLALVDKTTFTIPAAERGSISEYTVVNSTAPLFAIRPANIGVDVYILDVVRTATNTYKVRVATWNTSVAQPVTIYAFGRAAQTAVKYGRKLWNASSQIVFDSGWKFLRVVNFIFGIPTGDVVTPDSGRTLAAVITVPNIETNVDIGFENGPDGSGWFFTDTKQVCSAVRRTSSQLIITKGFYAWSLFTDTTTCSSGNPDQNDDCVFQQMEMYAGTFGSTGSGILIVDVTNY